MVRWHDLVVIGMGWAASEEVAGRAARGRYGRAQGRADYRALPRVTFADPEVASVGHTGVVKLVADAEQEVLVGGSVMGPAAGEDAAGEDALRQL